MGFIHVRRREKRESSSARKYPLGLPPLSQRGPTRHRGGTMDVTEVRVFPVEEDKLKAYVTITFDNCVVVRDLKIIGGSKGLFVAMPSKKRKDGTYRDMAHPLNNDTRHRIETRVLEEYRREIQRTR